MNAHAPLPAARHRFTANDVRAMAAAGVLDEGAKVELIDGELIDMPAEGPLHNDWSFALGDWLFRSLSRDDYVIIPGSTLVLSADNAPKPDWYVFPAALPTGEVRGADVLLAIEQSASTLAHDLGEKAHLYARHGVREYWVIDLAARRLHVHLDPAAEGYGSKRRHAADEAVRPTLLPHLELRLDDLTRVG